MLSRSLLILTALFVVGCGEAQTEAEYTGRPQWMECTDLRDGEVFRFHTNTMHDISVGLSTSSFRVIDTDKHERVMTSQSEQWTKCKVVQSNLPLPAPFVRTR